VDIKEKEKGKEEKGKYRKGEERRRGKERGGKRRRERFRDPTPRENNLTKADTATNKTTT